MGGTPGVDVPDRLSGCWRKKHAQQIIKLGILTQAHYDHLRAYLGRRSNIGP
jgi:hypothetical protein